MSPGKLGCLVLHNTQHRLSDCDRLLNPWGPRLQYTWRSLAEATAATLANTSPVRISVDGAIKSIISPIISKSTLHSVVIACTCENANFSLMVLFPIEIWFSVPRQELSIGNNILGLDPKFLPSTVLETLISGRNGSSSQPKKISASNPGNPPAT